MSIQGGVNSNVALVNELSQPQELRWAFFVSAAIEERSFRSDKIRTPATHSIHLSGSCKHEPAAAEVAEPPAHPWP